MTKYREDPDLEFLQYADNEMLQILANYLIYDKDGEKRITEDLSTNETFIIAKHEDDYRIAWKEIAAELQLFGGDSFVNLFRGTGVLYKEILLDVCGKMRIDDVKKSMATEDIEQRMILAILKQAWDDMPIEERKKIGQELKFDLENFADVQEYAQNRESFYKLAMLVSLSMASRFVPGLLAGLGIVGGVGVTRILGFLAGPIGITIISILSMPLISGAAYRVTIPCCIQVAAMRMKYLHDSGELL